MRNGRFRKPDAGKLLRALQKSLRRRVFAGYQSPAIASIVRAEESRLNAASALEAADFFSGQVRDGWQTITQSEMTNRRKVMSL